MRSLCSSLFVIILLLFTGCSDNNPPTRVAQTPVIKVGISSSFFAGPMLVAGAADLFSKYGLKAEIHRFESGKKAFQALLSGEVEVVSVADMPLMEAAFKRNDFAILATFSRSSNQGRLLASRTKITRPADLAGKKVGVPFFSTADYYLLAYLKYNSIVQDEVQIVNKDVVELANALKQGELDAIATWEPYATQAINLMGKENISEFYMTNIARVTFNLVTMKHLIEERPDALKGVIRAMSDAISLLHTQQTSAHELLAAELGTDIQTVSKNLPDYQMYMGLDQGLILVLEDEAEWYLQKHGINDPLPNFLEIVEPRLLRELYPDAVTLVN